MPKEDPSEMKTEKGKPDEPTTTKVTLRKPKLSFKEKQELAQLEEEIEQLEEEKKQIETALCSGNLSVEELTKLSKRLPELNDIIDTKTLRWMELEAVENG
jgi:ATP-binding cassette subfamily F protein uup